MKKIIAVGLSMLLLISSLPTFAYTLNTTDQAVLTQVNSKINTFDISKKKSIYQSLSKIASRYSGRSGAILTAIINHLETTTPSLKSFDGKISLQQNNTIKNSLSIGAPNAQYLVLEYSDIECPFCQRFMGNNTLNDLLAKYPNLTRKTFRHFPLSFHPNAMPSAIVAECIEQSYGVEQSYSYIKELMTSKKLSTKDLQNTATTLGFRNDAVQSCVTNQTSKTQVDKEIKEAQLFGVSGTPTTIILNTADGSYIKIVGAQALATIAAKFEQFKNGTYAPPVAAPVTAPTPAQAPTPKKLTTEQTNTLLADLPITTTANTEIVIIEYSDFQCPFCQRHHANKTLDNTAALFPGKVAIAFQHYPLAFHASARPAAIAAECVKETDGLSIFDAYVHQLFTDKSFTTAGLIASATTVGANTTSLSTCITDKTTDAQVTAQMNRGLQLFGVRGTPGNVILNSKTGERVLVSGAQGQAKFEAAIKSLLPSS